MSGSPTGWSAGRPDRAGGFVAGAAPATNDARQHLSRGAGAPGACPLLPTDNLTALRELALRFLADETEEQLLEYLRDQRKGSVWETHERILVGVTTAPGTDAIVRRAAQDGLADQG